MMHQDRFGAGLVLPVPSPAPWIPLREPHAYFLSRYFTRR